jgi:hypothetical protein
VAEFFSLVLTFPAPKGFSEDEAMAAIEEMLAPDFELVCVFPSCKRLSCLIEFLSRLKQARCPSNQESLSQRDQ